MQGAGDLLIGAALGALGATQGIALPGIVLIGVGFDATASIVYAANPNWFPDNQPIGLGDVAMTAVGTAVGWAIFNAIFPRENPPSQSIIPTVVAAGLAMLPVAGRHPGRLRRLPRPV